MFANGSEGEWEVVVPAPCLCSKPLGIKKSTHDVGSIWRCKCGQRWIISKWNTGDQRDGMWPTWDKMSQSRTPMPRE